MPDTQQFDLIVIGGGPAGYAAAFYAASAGLQVALVEKDTLGGTCLNRGCIPAKAFLETASVARHVQHAKDFGIEATQTGIEFSVAQNRKQRIVDGLVKGLTGLVRAKKVTYFLGVGSLGANRTVTVAGADGSTQVMQGRYVVLAAGSVPRTIPGFEVGGPIMTSDEVLMLDKIPARMVVIGGGAIGCEFASAFADLGSQVTILEGLPKILPGLDADLANVVVKSFGKKGISIQTGAKVNGHTPTATGGTRVHVEGKDDLEVDAVVVSVGRRPFPDFLGLEGTAVQLTDRRFVQVDEYCRTGEPGVYAIGDLINLSLIHI